MTKSFRSVKGSLLLIFVLCFSSVSLLFAQDDGPKSRNIVPVFETSRPQGTAQSGKPSTPQGTAGQSGEPSRQGSKPPKPNRPPYNRISQTGNSGKVGKENRPNANHPAQNTQTAQNDIQEAKAQQIGITLWKLLTTNYKGGVNVMDDDEYVPLINAGRTNYLTPFRASLNTLFESGDYVRLAIESGKRGYLYVVDQEMYADGSMGEAYLVFPSKRLKNGANSIAPGSPVEIPDLSNNPFYFELRPQSQNGKPIMAEVLSIIITDRPVAGLKIGAQPLLISDETLAGWRKKWAGRAEIFEPSETVKKGYTKAERQAADGKQKLSAKDPLPQTVFLVEGNRSGGTLITVPLWYGKE